MIHVRTDYQRIQDPSGRIPDDEPVFLLRAQDSLALETLHFYLLAAEDADLPKDMIQDLYNHIGRFSTWLHRKLPTYPPTSTDPETLAPRSFSEPDRTGKRERRRAKRDPQPLLPLMFPPNPNTYPHPEAAK